MRSSGVTDLKQRAQLHAELNGMIAHLYGLTEEEIFHILCTFPLVGEEVKSEVMEEYGNKEARFPSTNRQRTFGEWATRYSSIRGKNSWMALLSTFPLVAEEVMSAAMEEYRKRK